MGTQTVKVSAAMMRQQFRPCDPEFIATTCKAACCRSTTSPTGIAVTVTDDLEADRVRALGAQVDGLSIVAVNKRCPFQGADNMCSIWNTAQPWGCSVSPFTLNKNNTLIVRNRYRSLKCYRAEGSMPAYHAHRKALEALLGVDQTDALVAHLDAGGGDIHVAVDDHKVAWLHAKNSLSTTNREETPQ